MLGTLLKGSRRVPEFEVSIIMDDVKPEQTSDAHEQRN
jgi:hypothetical protein